MFDIDNILHFQVYGVKMEIVLKKIRNFSIETTRVFAIVVTEIECKVGKKNFRKSKSLLINNF